MIPVEFEVDARTNVRIKHTDNGTEIWIQQGEDAVVLNDSSASPASMVEALLAAIEAAQLYLELDRPALEPYGFVRSEA